MTVVSANSQVLFPRMISLSHHEESKLNAVADSQSKELILHG